MICSVCGSEMRVDDRDLHSRAFYDVYWVCTHCAAGCIEEIRLNRPFRELWHFETTVKSFDLDVFIRRNGEKVIYGSVPGGEDVTD